MKEKVLKLNIFTFIFVFLLFLTLEIDYISYFFHIEYLLSFSIALLFNTFISYFVLKKVKIITNIEKKDILFFTILFLIFIVTIVYPDRAFDTFNYHLYLQENPFGNKISYDFFSGKNLNSYTYAFPDRIFYIFRFFLGYRLGVILNYLLITIIYYNSKVILKKILVNSKNITIIIFSILISTSISLIDIIDSYYIDLVSLVLLFEIFRIVLFEKINDNNNSILLGYLSLLFGFSFVTKISNAFVLLVFFILYILKNKNIKKYINIKNIMLVCLLLFSPFLIYLIYNIIETGNPVFPFYNTIFKSKYFGNWDWLDKRFGPQNNLQVLAYPLIMFFHKNMTCDIAIIEPIWSLGYFVSIFYILYYIYRKIKKQTINKDKLFLSISTFIIYLVWAKFQLGYTRYGFISLVMGSLCVFIFIYDLFKKRIYLLLIPVCIFLIYNYTYSIKNYILLKEDWIYHNYFNSYSSYRKNLKNIFVKGNEKQIKFEEGSVWGIIYNNSGYAGLINSDIPIINITDSVDNKYTKKLLDKKLEKATHIYTLVDALDFENFLRGLSKTDYKIFDVKKVLSNGIISRDDSFTYIFELKKSNGYGNVEDIELEKKFDVSNMDNFECILGLNRWSNNKLQKDIKVKIIGDGKIIDEIVIKKNGKMDKYNFDVSEYNELEIKSEDIWLMIIYEKENK